MNISRLRICVAAKDGKPVLAKAFQTGTEVEKFTTDPGVEADEVFVFSHPALSYKETVKKPAEKPAKVSKS